MRFLPAWLRGYRRAWLGADVLAGIVIWSVVTPQAVAYAQIAGLPPEAGLMAAPGAMLAYGLLGTSRSLVVSATTATSAVSAAAVGGLAGGDVQRFAELSATLALVTAVVLVVAGRLRLGAVSDLVSTPVMTGFLFGLGLTILVAQAPDLVGVEPGSGDVFAQVGDLVGALDGIHWATAAVGGVSVVLLAAGRRFAPALPMTLIVLALAIVVSALLDLEAHGVEVVGELPRATPQVGVPSFSAADAVDLLAPALGIMLLTTEAVGVARGLATRDGYQTDPNRDLEAMGASNLLAGLSSGFVQSGGASQTAAADRAGGRTQLASIVAAGLVLVTGAFLAPLFTDLPQAALAAIVVVAIASFFDVAALRRFARLRRSAVVLAGAALAGVLALGVLQGLVVAAALSLVYVVKLLARPTLAGHVEGDDVLVVRSEAPLFYANARSVRDRVVDQAQARAARVVVLDLGSCGDLDVETLDTLAELHGALGRLDVELRLANARPAAAAMLERAGLPARMRVAPTVADALRRSPTGPPRRRSPASSPAPPRGRPGAGPRGSSSRRA